MKRIITLSAIFLGLFIPFHLLKAQNVGIGNSNPKAKLDIYGSLKLGTVTADSSSALRGLIRYNYASSNDFEGCYDGTNWVPLHTLWTKNGSSDIYRPSGKVGINWASPTGKFGVATDTLTDNVVLRKTIPGGTHVRMYSAFDSLNPFLIQLDTNHVGATVNSFARLMISTTIPNEFTIHQNGRIGIGTDRPGSYPGLETTRCEFASNDYNNSDWTLWVANDNPWGYPALQFAKSKGTISGPTSVSNTYGGSSDILGGLIYFGWDGSTFTRAAEMRTEIDATVSANVMPGRLIFLTNSNGAYSQPTERMRISSAGYVGINTQSPSDILDVNGRIRIRSSSSGNTTDRLYNNNGTLYFNGTPIGGSTGTVTSVGLSLPTEITVTNSPVTTSGTLTGTWATQTTNNVFAAPNGSTGTPTFRALVAADIPALSYESPLTFNNGLTRTTNTITLGGTLNAITSIDNATFAFTLGGAAATGALTLGSSSGAQTVNIGTGTGAGTVNISTGAGSASAINIGTGAVANTLTLGNIGASTSFVINSGKTTGNSFDVNNNSLTTGTLMDIASSSTAGNGSKLLNLSRSGANGTAAVTNYGLYSAISNTGTTATNIAADLKSSGGTNNIALRLEGSTSGTLDISPAAATTSYTLTLPAAQGAASTFLQNNGSGTLSWVAGGAGSVTSVGLSLPTEITVTNSPVTTSGTLTGTWATQTTNKVFAAPNGSTGTPSFRALVAADIPALSYESPLTFNNGLTRTTNTITLGGTLNAITSIDNATFGFTLGGAAATGALTLGSSSGAQTVNIGTGTGAGTVNIATGASSANSINIGTGAVANTLTFGNTGAAASFVLNSGKTTGNSFDINNNSLTTGTLMDIGSTSTAGNGSKLLNLTRSGANGTAAVTNYGLYSAISNTGTTATNIAADLKSSGGTNNIALRLEGSTSGTLDISPAATTTSYTLTLPSAQGAASTFLQNNGSGTLSWVAGGAGSVTSVGLSLPTEITVTNSPVTTSGTLTGTWATQTTNKVFAAPNGSTGTPTFRALVAADIPALSYESPLTFNNGLTRTTNTITLGGTLNAITSIDNATFGFTLGGAAATGALTLGSSSGAQTVNIGTGTGAGTVNIATGATSANAINIGTGAVANTLTFGNTGAAASFVLNSGKTTGNSFDINNNSLTTGTLMDIGSTSTAGNGSKLLNLTRSGANGTAAVTNYGLYSAISNTGTTATNIAADLKSSGGTNNIALRLEGSTSGTLDISPAAATTSYTLTLPAAQGAASTILQNNGSGVLSWATTSSLLAGTSGQTLRHDGTNWVANSFLFNNGTSIGINTPTPSASYVLDVAGNMNISTPAAPSVLNIDAHSSTSNIGKIIFTNTAGTGDYQISGDGGDIFWQGGGGRNLQMGAYWGMDFTGGRGTTTAMAFSNGVTNNYNTRILNATDVTGLIVQANGTQTNNLQEWRNSAGAGLSAVDELGQLGIGITVPTQKLEVSNGNVIISNTNNTPGELRLTEGSTSGANYTSFKATTQAANITYTLPAAQGAASSFLQNNGSGTLSWVTGGAGSVTSVATSQPAAGLTISGGPITTSGTFTFALANSLSAIQTIGTGGTNGLLKRTGIDTWSTITDNSTNWDAAYTNRLVSASGTAPLTLTLAANALTGSMTQAATGANGWLSSTDWNTFNNKMTNPMTTAGDIIYGGASGTPSRLADVATGNVLLSGGVGVAPAWGKVGLTTHVSGTLPVANGGTGQSSNLVAGGVLYGASTSAAAVTAAGTSGQFLQSSGSGAPTWAGLGVLSGITVLTTASSSPYTVPAGVTKILVELVGGGGGGAGGVTSGSNCVAGGGGGGGGYVRVVIPTSPGATFAFTVGSGGPGSTNSNASAGGSTTFPSQTAGGGDGGVFMTAGTSITNVNGGVGGTATGGDLNIPGGNGGEGIRFSATIALSGVGGSSTYAGTSRGTGGNPNVNITGNFGVLYGGGGAGSQVHRTSNGPWTATGGDGADGVIIITEFK